MLSPYVLAPLWVFIAVTFVVAPARADTAPIVDCTEGSYLELKPIVRWKALSTLPKLPKDRKKVRRWTFGPFDEATYGYSTLEFVAQLVPKVREFGEPDGRFKLFVNRKQNGDPHWFEMGLVTPTGSDVMETRAASGSLWVEENGKAYETFANLRQIGPDRSVPLFSLDYQYFLMGGNTDTEATNTEILDFRHATPQSPMVAECFSNSGGGACGAYDLHHMPLTTLKCDWSELHSDILCLEVTTDGLDWRRRFSVSSKKSIGPENAVSIEAVAAAAVKGDQAKHADGVVPGVGKMTVLHVLVSQGGGDASVLMAGPGKMRDLNARFFIAKVREQGTVQIEPLQAKPIWHNAKGEAIRATGERNNEGAHSYAPDAPFSLTHFAFDTQVLMESGQVTVLRVVVSSMGLRAQYWVGMDRSGASVITDVLRVASEGMYYVECDHFFGRSPSAFKVSLSPATLSATLRILPFQMIYPEKFLDEKAKPLTLDRVCDWTAQVAWTSEEGFVLRHTNRICNDPAEAHVVNVGADGKLSAVKTGDQLQLPLDEFIPD